MESQKIEYDEVLNQQQLDAVMTLDGPVLVIAGAGSGKTRTLIYRVARLVETGVSPENILLLTFTRKAAGEMLDRAAGLSDERCRRVSGGTFHSLAHRVLRMHAPLVGFETTYTILDRADMEEAIQSMVGEMKIEKGAIRFPKRATLASIISKAANLQCSIDSLIREEYGQFLEYTADIHRLHTLYSAYKKENQLLDYDDLILCFRKLLAEHEDVREELSRKYRYIMVDEYQDTNAIQADIVKWLAWTHRNIMVVGDDSQSIYSFRGADYRNMFEFPEQFPDTKIIKLEENYRSTQPILTFTNALMGQAREKYTKCLFTNRSDGEMPRAIDTRTDPEQAIFICRSIKEELARGRSLKDFSVLFRAAFHSFELEVELTRQGLPFVKYGGFKFMESAHIKDLLGHLRVVVNRDDAVSWGRILRLIKNIGQRKSQAVINWMKENQCRPHQVSDWPGSGRAGEGLKALSRLLEKLSGADVTPHRAVELLMEYYDPILIEKFDDFPRRRKDLEQLLTMADRYQKLRAFLDEIVLEPPTSPADLSAEQRKDCLTLSTVHSAKGLEWPVVFVIWVMDGYFPSAKSASTEEALEEERRLMYVGATRAKDRLVLCYPGMESPPVWASYGEHGLGYRRGISSFIQALPPDVIESLSAGYTPYQTPVTRPIAGSGHEEKSPGHPEDLKSGDKVNHPAFGVGVISRFMDSEKVKVLFRNAGRKLLHLGYTTLEKV
ncbi:MAG: UvrD-helicase domain-containing protein [Deltaproteobacteria bacterium]|nr:UvrD-helicase domain-containing protein [Deltaproteobacteria bacterium]